MSKHIIGASQIATVLGKNKFQTPHELWTEMVEGCEREVNDHMVRGTCSEQGILDFWQYKTGGYVRRQVRLALPSDKRLGATLDALAILDGELILVETKSPATGHDWHEGRAECPFMYRLQVVFQLGVAEANGYHCTRGELVAAWVFGKMLRFNVEPEPKLFALMVAKAQEFLSFVERKEPLPSSWAQAQPEVAA